MLLSFLRHCLGEDERARLEKVDRDEVRAPKLARSRSLLLAAAKTSECVRNELNVCVVYTTKNTTRSLTLLESV